MIEAIIREKLNRPVAAAGLVVGFDDVEAQTVLNALWPSLSLALKDSIKSPRELSALTSLVKKGQDYARYVEHPDALSEPNAINDGEAVLKILLGSDTQQNAVAKKAAEAANLDFTAVDNFMSLMASAMLGAFAIQMRDTDFTAALAKGALGMVGLGGLSGMVDKHLTKDKRKKMGRSFGGMAMNALSNASNKNGSGDAN